MTSAPVSITITEINGPRTLSWTRLDRNDVTDQGRWSGSEDWVESAQTTLATRLPVLVARPDLHYRFGLFDGTLPVHDVAAAMVAVGEARGDCAEAIAELPDDLFDDTDVPDGAVF